MIELKLGQFIKITGANIKCENDIYIVDFVNKNKNGFWLNKVKLDGTKKESGHELFGLNKNIIKENPSLQIEIITDLKKAKKEVNEYLKNRNAEKIRLADKEIILNESIEEVPAVNSEIEESIENTNNKQIKGKYSVGYHLAEKPNQPYICGTYQDSKEDAIKKVQEIEKGKTVIVDKVKIYDCTINKYISV